MTWCAQWSRWASRQTDDLLGLPDMALMLTDALVVFDHLKHTITILANADLDAEPDLELRGRPRRARSPKCGTCLAGPVPAARPGSAGADQTRARPRASSRTCPGSSFEAMVERIVEYIYAGDAFQVVPSQRWSAKVPVEAFSIYRGLRTVNPSPYMYFLDFGDFQVAGASPEPLLTVTGRQVSTRPIAGTRPRGATPRGGPAHRRELLEDEKERAEHMMLVDLGRNDLGRVCEYGSVVVDELMEVETYSHVMHIVSSVSGTLREDVGAMDALRSVLPAGTLSGAPKVRAMQIIDELESTKRGGYGGAIGYLSYGGDLDTAIHIRTVVIKDGVAHVQAGGGTVADAKPHYEYEESVNKSKAVLRAVELACEQADWGMRVLVIDNYDSFTYNLVQYLGELGAEVCAVRNDRATVDDLLEAGYERCVISPGPCTPNEAGISLEVAQTVARSGHSDAGVCLGHQSMAQAFGGTVKLHDPIHGKATTIEHDGRTIFPGLSSP